MHRGSVLFTHGIISAPSSSHRWVPCCLSSLSLVRCSSFTSSLGLVRLFVRFYANYILIRFFTPPEYSILNLAPLRCRSLPILLLSVVLFGLVFALFVCRAVGGIAFIILCSHFSLSCVQLLKRPNTTTAATSRTKANFHS